MGFGFAGRGLVVDGLVMSVGCKNCKLGKEIVGICYWCSCSPFIPPTVLFRLLNTCELNTCDTGRRGDWNVLLLVVHISVFIHIHKIYRAYASYISRAWCGHLEDPTWLPPSCC